MKWRMILLGIGSVLFLLVTFLLLLGVNMRRGLNHDEYQFVASGELLATVGLLPYLDFPYFHVPGLSLIYAGLFQFSQRLLLSARLFSVFCAWLMTVLLFGSALVELHHQRSWIRVVTAVGLVLLLLASPIFIYTSGRAWNHDLPMLLTVIVFLIFDRHRGKVSQSPRHTASSQTARLSETYLRGFQPALIGCGVLLGLATATRLSFAFAMLALMLTLLVQPQTSWPRRWQGMLTVGIGGFLGMTPALLFLFWSPQAFLFGNLTYIGLNTQYYGSLTTPPDSMTWFGKLGFIGDLLWTEPANALPILCLGLVTGLVWRTQHNAAALWRLQPVVILFLSMLLSGLVATPSQPQYFYPLWPLLILGLILLLGIAHTGAQDGNVPGSSKDAPRQQEWRLVRPPYATALPILLLLVTSVVTGFLSRSPYLAGLEIVFSPREWYPNKLHARGSWVSAVVNQREDKQGDVLTVAPIIPLEGGVTIYPELATGPFAWRVAPYLAAEERQRYHLFTPDELIKRLRATPPPALLVGLENDDADIEEMLVQWAQMQGYVPIALPDEGMLWVSPLAEWGGAIRLGAHTLPQHGVRPGETVAVVFYLQNLQPLESNLNLLVRLVGEDGQEYWRAEGWPWGAATADWTYKEVWPDGRQITLPADTPLGCYRVEMSFYDPETFKPLGHIVKVGHLWVSDQPDEGNPCL